MADNTKEKDNVVPTTCKCQPLGDHEEGEFLDIFNDDEGDMSKGGYDRIQSHEIFISKTALVAGALTAVGKKVVADLSEQGVSVIAIDNSRSSLAALRQAHHHVKGIAVDLSDWKKTSNALSGIGQIDFLVNCAETNEISSVADITEANVDNIFTVNVKATVNVIKIAVRKFIQHQIKGSIVNVSSQASIAGLRNQALYCASKAAIDGYTRAAAVELGSFGIRINCVNPTVTSDEIKGKIWSDPRMRVPMLSRIPLQRFCELQDVSDAILFLLSDKASFITGTSVSIDGGFTIT